MLAQALANPTVGQLPGATRSSDTSAFLARLPRPAHMTIQAQAGRNRINLVQEDTTTVAGQTLYKVGFVQNGRQHEIYVNRTGELVDAKGMPITTRSLAPLTGQTRMNFRQVPNPARWIIQAQSRGARIENIERGVWNGQTVYQAAFNRHGQNVQLQVAENGHIIHPSWAETWTSPTARVLTVEQLPAPVRRTIRAQAGNAGVQMVQVEPYNGQTAYRAQFLRNGELMNMVLAKDGTLLVSPTAVSSSNLAPLTGVMGIEMSQVPAEAQRILRDQAGLGQIQSVARGQWNGQNVYQAMINNNGTIREVQVAENGTIINLPYGAARPSGAANLSPAAPGQAQFGVHTERFAAQNMAPLTGVTAAPLNQVPREIQRILRDQALGGQIQSVEQGQWRGQPVYQATINQNGQLRTVQVERNGTILNGPNGYLSLHPELLRPAGAAGAANLVPLGGQVPIHFDQVPPEVRRILRDQAQGGQIQSVVQGTWGGQPVFEATINQNGITRRVQVERNGTILNGPQDAALPK